MSLFATDVTPHSLRIYMHNLLYLWGEEAPSIVDVAKIDLTVAILPYELIVRNCLHLVSLNGL